MTTIAIRKYSDRIELAADSFGIDGDIGFPKKKIYSKHPNFIFGSAGMMSEALLLNSCISSLSEIDLLSEEELYKYLHIIKDKFQTDGNDTEAFLIIFNSRIYDLRLNKSSVDLSEIENFYSIGNGRKFALAAMECGKSPREAVEVAIKYDIYSGGEVQEEIIKLHK